MWSFIKDSCGWYGWDTIHVKNVPEVTFTGVSYGNRDIIHVKIVPGSICMYFEVCEAQ